MQTYTDTHWHSHTNTHTLIHIPLPPNSSLGLLESFLNTAVRMILWKCNSCHVTSLFKTISFVSEKQSPYHDLTGLICAGPSGPLWLHPCPAPSPASVSLLRPHWPPCWSSNTPVFSWPRALSLLFFLEESSPRCLDGMILLTILFQTSPGDYLHPLPGLFSHCTCHLTK